MQSVVVCLLFVLTACSANFYPPVLNISLDQAPELRWAPLKEHFSKEFLQQAAAQVIDSTIPAWVHRAFKPVVRSLEQFTPQPYAAELRGMAALYGIDIADILMVNFAYEVSAFCTSIVAQDTKGNIYHGRNMDYPHHVLRNLTINVLFIKNGEVAYRGTTFAGYVGLWTGQSKNKFTVSGNQRDSGHWWYNIIAAVLLKNSPVSWLVRETLEEASSFLNAVTRLSDVPIISGVYYVVGGVYPGEAVVITRDRSGPADIWPLDISSGKSYNTAVYIVTFVLCGLKEERRLTYQTWATVNRENDNILMANCTCMAGWYRVQTNYDHWLPTPKHDNRREVAMKVLNITGENNINLHTLYRVLSVKPVCNRITLYTTLMSAAAPEEYRTIVKETCGGSTINIDGPN